jgi:hypothetical protein
MIFSVTEQTSTAGEIEIELEEKEIQSLIQKLKQKESKRVCVHLVNAHKNSLNTEKLSSALSEAGFEVFNPLTLMKKVGLDLTPTDFPLWRLNLIEASTSGTFCELKDQINEAFSPYIDKQKIKFLDHNLKAHDGEAGSRISTLFAAENAVFQFLRNKNIIPEKTDVFHFGQENFSILNSNKQCWQSPWGTTGIQTFVRQDLKIQPTNSFYLNSFEEIEENLKRYVSEGFEGQILRDPDTPYENKRSNGLLKHKNFFDEEFEIIGYSEGIGKFSGKLATLRVDVNGVEVDCTINGRMEYLEELFQIKDSLIGKKATVKYFEKTTDNSLRFPKVINIDREQYEG